MWLSSADKVPGDVFCERRLPSGSPGRPPMVRTRSKSDAEIRVSSSRLKAEFHPSPTRKKQRHASSGAEEKWLFKGYVQLIDVEVVISPPRESGEHMRLEVLSPRISFALYAGTYGLSSCESLFIMRCFRLRRGA